jgi:hypothetical protein
VAPNAGSEDSEACRGCLIPPRESSSTTRRPLAVRQGRAGASPSWRLGAATGQLKETLPAPSPRLDTASGWPSAEKFALVRGSRNGGSKAIALWLARLWRVRAVSRSPAGLDTACETRWGELYAHEPLVSKHEQARPQADVPDADS